MTAKHGFRRLLIISNKSSDQHVWGGPLILSVQQTGEGACKRSGQEGEIVEFFKNNCSFNIKKKRPALYALCTRGLNFFPCLQDFPEFSQVLLLIRLAPEPLKPQLHEQQTFFRKKEKSPPYSPQLQSNTENKGEKGGASICK